MKPSTKFLFQTTKNIMLELGAASRVGELMASSIAAAPRLGASSTNHNILFVTDKGLHDMGMGDSCITGLKKMGFNVEVYADVVADPPEARIVEAVEFAKSKNISGVVGFGGGSR
jgi:alcohol dehydrogenase class IV